MTDDELPGRVVYAIDDVEVRAGRVWRTGQDGGYTMTTVAGQITTSSGVPDGDP